MSAMSVAQVAERWLTARESAAHCRVSLRTFWAEVAAGRYPPGKPTSRRRKVWSQAELDAAISGKKPMVSDPVMAAIHASQAQSAALR